MGARKRNRANDLKEARKELSFAKLNNCQTSPRKMRLVADMIRGMNVEKAMHVLKTSPKHAARDMRKLLLSAVANWEEKNENLRMEESNLFVQKVFVDSARALKRLQTAPQGRAHRILKRSNHVTLHIGSRNMEMTEIEDNNEKNKE
jgi:large subunit ribosomal protein L22